MDEENKQEENSEENIEPKTLVESGSYEIHSSEDGSVLIDKLKLDSDNGESNRIWKLKSITPKEIVFEIEKFG